MTDNVNTENIVPNAREDRTSNTEEKSSVCEKLTNKEALAYLAKKFPNCFFMEGEAKPLKINIFKDLVEALKDDNTMSKTQLRQVLRLYTTNWRYLHGCREGAERIDLNGNPCGCLELEHVIFARDQLSEAKAKVAQKRKEMRLEHKKEAHKKTHHSRHYKGKHPKSKYASLPTEQVLQLVKGDEVKVKIGERIQIATILETAKDDMIRVQVKNGLTMSLSVAHLLA